MITVLGFFLAGVFLWQSADPPDISGRWTGDEWGQVVLEEKQTGTYEGTYTDTFGTQAGELQLQWSRIERRFKGTWREGEDRYGKISVRMLDDRIRGAWTTNEKSRINPANPELADLLWVRPPTAAAVATPGIHVKFRLHGEKHSREMLRKNIGFDQLSIMGSGITGTIEGKASDNLVAVLAHRCRLESFEETEHRGKKYWDATFFVPQGPTSDGSNLQLSQKRLDQMHEQGVQFWLDHHRDQFPSGKKHRLDQPSEPDAPAGEPNAQSLAARPEVLSASEAIEQGQALYNSRKKVTVRYRVASATSRQVMDEQGKTSQRWYLSSKEATDRIDPTSFSIQLSPEAEAELHKLGVTNVPRHYLGKTIEVEGAVYGAGLDLISRPDTIWIYHMDVTSLGQIRIVDSAAERPKTTTAMPKRLHDFPTGDRFKTIAYSADGKLIAIAKDKDDWKRSVEILDAGLVAGKTIVSLKLTTKEEDALLAATEGLPHFEVEALAFSPDAKVLAVGTGLGQVKLFNARTGELVLSLDDEPAKLAEKKTPEKLKSLRRAIGSAQSLAFSPDGSLLASCGSSFEEVPLVFDAIERGGLGRSATGPGRLKVWEVKTGTLKHDLVGHSHADAVSFSADGTLLASSGRWGGDRDNGTGVIIWNALTGKQVSTILQEANSGTHAVVFSPTNKLVAIGSRHYDKENDTYTTAVSVAYALSGITEWKQTIPGWANPKAFSPDGKSVVVLCGGQSIRFIKTETGEVQHEIKSADFLPATPRQGSQWFDFAITPTDPRLAIGGVDKEGKVSVEIWDLGGLGSAASSAPAKDGEKQDGKQ